MSWKDDADQIVDSLAFAENFRIQIDADVFLVPSDSGLVRSFYLTDYKGARMFMHRDRAEFFVERLSYFFKIGKYDDNTGTA